MEGFRFLLSPPPVVRAGPGLRFRVKRLRFRVYPSPHVVHWWVLVFGLRVQGLGFWLRVSLSPAVVRGVFRVNGQGLGGIPWAGDTIERGGGGSITRNAVAPKTLTPLSSYRPLNPKPTMNRAGGGGGGGGDSMGAGRGRGGGAAMLAHLGGFGVFVGV